MIDFDAITEKHKEIERKKKAAEKFRERATDTSVHITNMPKGGGGNKQEILRVEMIAAQEAQQEAERELLEMLRPLRAKVKRLKKWQYRDTIRKRFIEGKTIQRTAEEIGYEWSQTNRYLNEAKTIINRT